MSNEAARQREGEAHDEDNEMAAIVDEERELLLQEAISRLNAVYVLSTKEHGVESVHWTMEGASGRMNELKKFAAYRNAQFRTYKHEVIR